MKLRLKIAEVTETGKAVSSVAIDANHKIFVGFTCGLIQVMLARHLSSMYNYEPCIHFHVGLQL